MSNNIYDKDGLLVTAFVGSRGSKMVQISVCSCYIDKDTNHEYALLSEDDALKLAHALLSRVIGVKGYQATDTLID